MVDRRILLSSRGELARIRRNPASSFLFEGGRHWAVHLTGEGHVIDPTPAFAARIKAEIERKYAGCRTPDEDMPAATRDHYPTSEWATVEFVPDARMLTWNNRKLAVSA